MADYMRKYGEVKKLEAPVSTTSVVFALTGINAAFEKDGKIGSQTWKEIDKNCAKVNGKVPKRLLKSLDLWYGDASYTAEKQYLKLMEDKVINKTLMLMSEDWTDEGIVDGYVYNTSGKALADAKVEVYSGVDYTVEEPEMILYTDAKGYFNTDFMITGGYTFVISKDGYKKQSVYQPVIGYVQSTIKRIKMRRENNG